MSEDARVDRIKGYYEAYNEDVRLQNLKSRRTEFLTTNHILNRYIEPHSLILDLGCASGCYSLYYAALGHRVVARDLVSKHIDELKLNPQSSELGIDTGVADARDLREFGDETFDVVLCFGPYYHIGEPNERKKCIAECLRVMKPGGILAIAYISKFFVYSHIVRHKKEYLSDDLTNEILSNDVALEQNPRNIWFFDSPEEVEKLLAEFDMEPLAHAAADGISILLADTVNSFDEQEYQQWLKYHFKTCQEPSLLGYSNHNLFVCKKS